MMALILGLTTGEFTVAVITSLVASIVFWLVFDRFPRRVAQRRIQPLVNYDLYQVYSKLFQYLETPFRQFEHSPSQFQTELFTGVLSMNDFKVFLSTKCLSESYQSIDENSGYLFPIGEKLQKITDDIEETINQLYVFNHYLSAEQILICRQILDKLKTYSYDLPSSQYHSDGSVTHCVNPTANYLAKMFYEVYALFMRLQNYLIDCPQRDSVLCSNYRMLLASSKLSSLYNQGKYKKVCHLTKKTQSPLSAPFHFRSLYRLGKTALAKEVLIDYLKSTSMRLVYMRNAFEDVIKDQSIMSVLVAERSEDEVNEMINCLNRESKNKAEYRSFAELMMEYYQKKETDGPSN